MEKLITFFREIVEILFDGLKCPKAVAKEVAIPKNMRKVFFLSIGMTAILVAHTTITSLLLSQVNNAIDNGKTLLGVFFLLLYLGKDIIKCELRNKESRINLDYQRYEEEEATILTANIFQGVFGKIGKVVGNHFVVLGREELLTNIREYLLQLWGSYRNWYNNIISLISAITLIIGVIKTNNEIPFRFLIFIILLVTAFNIKLIHARMNVTTPLRKKGIDLKNINENFSRDMYLQGLTKSDGTVKSERCRVTFKKMSSIRWQEMRASNGSRQRQNMLIFILSVVLALSKIHDAQVVDLETITRIMAVLAVFNEATIQINSLVNNLASQAESSRGLDERAKMMQQIMAEYNREEVVGEIKEKLEINPFDLQYKETSQNDKPFELILKEKLEIHLGEVVVLTGPSASGKSTLMKVATDRVRTNQGNHYVARNRYMYIDETTALGTAVPLYSELFNLVEATDFISEENFCRMEEILKNLNLWYEIQKRAENPWQWLKEHRYMECSNGQKQRFIIAKLLYHLSSEIDVICLDEVTSGLDEYAMDNMSAGAHEVMSYIIQKCNEDRKRIIFISTHQKSIEAMADRQLDFKEDGTKNYIKEVKV